MLPSGVTYFTILHLSRCYMSVIGLLLDPICLSTNLSFLYLLNKIIIVIRKRAVMVFLWKWEDIDNQVKYGTVFRYSCYYEKYVENRIFHGNSYLNCRKRIYLLILCHIIHVPLPETYCSIWTFLTSSSILSIINVRENRRSNQEIHVYYVTENWRGNQEIHVYYEELEIWCLSPLSSIFKFY